MALNLALAAAYFGTGKLGLLLAIPPGFATAVWPPAGIALAAVLALGYRVTPGAWLGSFLANTSTSFDGSTAGAAVGSLVLAGAIGVGAAAQAAAGAWLVRRFVGFPTPLHESAEVGKFLVLSGPVSCLLSPTVGVSCLWAMGRVSGADCFSNWWTWWVGDSIGALTLTGLMLIWVATPRPAWLRRQLMVSLPLCLLFALVVVLFIYTSRREKERLQDRIDRRAALLAETIQDRLKQSFAALYALRNAIHLNAPLEPKTLHTLFELNRERWAGLEAISLNPLVRHTDRAGHEAAMRRAGQGDYQVRERRGGQLVPASIRKDYVPVALIEPHKDHAAAVGFDVASEEARREALTAARDSALATATRPLRLVQNDPGSIGVLVFLPIYRTPQPPTTVVARREALLGYAVGVYHPDRLAADAIGSAERDGLQLALIDLAAPPGEQTLIGGSDGEGLRPSTPIAIAGREWHLEYAPTPGYLAANRSLAAWSVLAVGLLFMALLEGFLLLVTGREATVEALVTQRTTELTQALAEIKTLRGMLPICAWCKKVRDDQGLWQEIERYLAAHTEAELTHGICQDCLDRQMKALRQGAS